MVMDRTSRTLRLVHPAPHDNLPGQSAPTATLGPQLVPQGRIVLANYICPEGHGNRLPFAVSEHTPLEWDCRCGLVGHLKLPDIEVPAPVNRVERQPDRRTHWDRVRARRTPAELQRLLDERVMALRAQEAGATVTAIGTWNTPDRLAQ